MTVCMTVDWYQDYKLAKDARKLAKEVAHARGQDSLPPLTDDEKNGIYVRDLTKIFNVKEGSFPNTVTKKLRAVDNLTLKVPGQSVFVLLGHNGAGKSTTLNMLVGATIPSSGDAWVHGKHIVEDRGELRKVWCCFGGYLFLLYLILCCILFYSSLTEHYHNPPSIRSVYSPVTSHFHEYIHKIAFILSQ